MKANAYHNAKNIMKALAWLFAGMTALFILLESLSSGLNGAVHLLSQHR